MRHTGAILGQPSRNHSKPFKTTEIALPRTVTLTLTYSPPSSLSVASRQPFNPSRRFSLVAQTIEEQVARALLGAAKVAASRDGKPLSRQEQQQIRLSVTAPEEAEKLAEEAAKAVRGCLGRRCCCIGLPRRIWVLLLLRVLLPPLLLRLPLSVRLSTSCVANLPLWIPKPSPSSHLTPCLFGMALGAVREPCGLTPPTVVNCSSHPHPTVQPCSTNPYTVQKS